MADIARLTRIIEPEAQALGFDLVRVKMMPSEAGDGGLALQVMAEDPATGQLVLDQCAALSRRVSDAIDRAEEAGEVLIEGVYHLEVSSPGIDRPLTRAKDYLDWKGHQARLTLHPTGQGPKQITGRIEGISGDVVLLTTPAGAREVPLQTISSAKLLLTDELIKATAPLSTEGADLIEETEG